MKHWFLDSEFPNSKPENARFHIIPFPLEETVSYMGGTAKGPEAIIEASSQLEQLVEGYGNPGRLGMYTAEAVNIEQKTHSAIEEASKAMIFAHACHAIPVLLGGEHSVTNAVIGFLHTCYQKGEVGVLQFDAHMDLRSSYEGSELSHACVMRRVVESGIDLFQVGIRNYSEEDLAARQSFHVLSYDASYLYRQKDGGTSLTTLRLPDSFPKKLYITFDVDGLDASLMSATGTPDPGGLSWWDSITMLETLTQGRTIIGMDVVELAPNALHHTSYTASKLTYFLMGLASKRSS
ncbi:MAG: agmatinase [Sphaerochaeta sp.]|jgi:agmatinase|uniref:agmatinase n=1 Tax=Sphaerochaeta sp. TaxID=1972642 RepID=UPI002FCAD685